MTKLVSTCETVSPPTHLHHLVGFVLEPDEDFSIESLTPACIALIYMSQATNIILLELDMKPAMQEKGHP
jgi:hypothetical protein